MNDLRPGYRFFDHTGDFGVDLWGPDRGAVQRALARAFLDLLTGAPDAVRPREERALVATGLDDADALVALGNELLFLFEGEGFLCADLALEPHDDEDNDDEDADPVDDPDDDSDPGDDIVRIVATARGEPFDPDRHPIARPIKAVTHHAASCAEDPSAPPEERVRARLVFDL